MRNLVYTCKIQRNSDSTLLGFLMVIPIICLIMLGMFLFIENRRLPQGLQGTQIYFILLFVISTAICIGLYLKSRIDFNMYTYNKKLVIEIEDPKLVAPISIQSPFTLKKQWYKVDTGNRAVKMKEVCLTFYDAMNEPQLTIKSVLGAMYDAPEGWDFIDVYDPEERARLSLSNTVYTNSKAEEIYLEIQSQLAMLQ